MKIGNLSIMRDGGRLIVNTSIEFGEDEGLSPADAEQFIKDALSEAKTKRAQKIAATYIDPAQDAINRQLGVSKATFAKFSAK